MSHLITPVATVTDQPNTKILWGTYGKSGNEPLVYKPLESLDTEHLINISITQFHIYNNKWLVVAIANLLISRNVDPVEYRKLCTGALSFFISNVNIMYLVIKNLSDKNKARISL